MLRHRHSCRAVARMGLAAVVVAAFVLPGLAQIRGTMSNFDAWNGTPRPVTNLELDLRLVQPVDVRGFYHGPNAWGLPPVVRDISGSEVVWADFRRPILPGEMRHFGLRLVPGVPAPCGVTAHWTRHVKIAEIPVPWQTWRPQPGQVVDVIRLSPEFAEPVVVVREFAASPERLPLDRLNWNEASVLWRPVPGDPTLLPPGAEIELPIPVEPFERAVFVRYTVALARNPENVVARFVNEAEIEQFQPVPAIVGSLSNFDAMNDTGKPVHDLELDILNVQPNDVLDWYRGPDAWGLHPVTLDPSIRPFPGGTEVTWVDEWSPLAPRERRHFGLRLHPGTPEPLVRAFWTRVVKVRPVPVPWQWWERAPGGVLRDVIQLSDTFPEPVTILREWATSTNPVPLDQLMWDNPMIPWQPDPAGPIVLEPGIQSFFDIQLGAGSEAAFVRYTVTRMDGTVETRFVNEVELGPSPGQPAIRGLLSNFDVVNLTQQEMTNFELDFRTIRPWHILDWYRGPMAWGLHPVFLAPALLDLPQTELAWTAFRDPLPPESMRHFGVELAPDAPPSCGVTAHWTRHVKVVEIPVPWQTWRVPPLDPPQVVDVVRLSPEAREPVLVAREFARVPFRVPLENLNWDLPDIPWTPVLGDPVLLAPGQEVQLPIEVTPIDQAVLVRYTVAPGANPPEVLTRFVNEAEISFGPQDQPPMIVGSLSNFDAINATGKPVHDLELDIKQIHPADVWDWYRGPNAWGIDPVIGPIDGGTEVTWVDDVSPMLPGEMRHFGLRLNPATPEPLVRAFWTREVKVAPIPLPWQFWVVPPGPFVRDVVQLADLFGEPVVIRREFAVRPEPVPLDQLNWDVPAPWVPDPAGPITLRPGDQASLDVPVGPQDGALLVRYTAQTLSGGPPVRIVNQAALGPGVVSGLRIKSDKQTIAWNASPVAGTLFDIVTGRLTRLQATGGIHEAACAPGGNDMTPTTYTAAATPPAGDGDYYVVRSQNGAIRGTYDTTTDPLRREGRDLEIGPGDCP